MFPAAFTNKAKKILKKLKEKNLKLVFAESCTGGLLSALFTEISGSSKTFDRGFVTYSNEAKNEMLGVKKTTLKNFGAVSAETAKEMAIGAIKNSQADISIAITGIAGPDGGSEKKPVGLVYIAKYFDKKTEVQKFNFSGNRLEVRAQAVKAALEMIHSI
jgi:PncC family amidohydrolase